MSTRKATTARSGAASYLTAVAGAGGGAQSTVNPNGLSLLIDPVAATVVATPGVVELDDRGQTVLVALHAVAALRRALPMAWRGDEPWIWGDRCWVPGERRVRRICQHIGAAIKPHGSAGIALGDRLWDLLVSELRADAPATPEAMAMLWDARPIWPCADGSLDVTDPQHPVFYRGAWNPDDHMTYWIDADWDPVAADGAVTAWLQTVLPDRDARDALLDMAGYSLARFDLRYQALAFLVGRGSNGKSTFLRVLQQLLPGYTATVGLDTLARDRFAGSRLLHAVVNLVGDQSGEYLKDTAQIKQLTGQDPVHAERKFRDAYTAYPKITNWFAMNAMPRTDDISHGWLRRLLIIPFPNRFAAGGWDESQLWTPSARSTWLRLAAEGYARLCSRPGFDWSAPGVAEPRDIYHRDLDVVARAVGEDVLRIDDPTAHIDGTALQALMRSYADSIGQKAPRLTEIVRRLQTITDHPITEQRPGGRGEKRPRRIVGVGPGPVAWQIETTTGNGQHTDTLTLAERANLSPGDNPGYSTTADPDREAAGLAQLETAEV